MFYNWNDIDLNEINNKYFVIVNNNYINDSYIKILPLDHNNLNIYPTHYLDNKHPDFLIYIIIWKSGPKVKNNTYIFRKNKLYRFVPYDIWHDELLNEINSNNMYSDISYDPFLFIHEKDSLKVERLLKLKNLDQI